MSKFFNKTNIKNNITFIENFSYEDQEFTLKLLSYTHNRFMKIRYPFYYYRMDREGSTTNTYTLKKGTDLISVMKSMIEYIKSKEASEQKVLYMTVNIALYHLSNLWIKSDDHSKKFIIEVLRNEKDIYKYGMLENNFNLRMKIQNKLFCKFPKVLSTISKAQRKAGGKV